MGNRIKHIATAICVATLVFSLSWSLQILSWLLPLLFADDKVWHALNWTDQTAEISLTIRVCYALLWSVLLATGWTLTYFTIRLMLTLRKGHYFSLNTAYLIKAVGGTLSMFALNDTLFATLSPVILSLNAANGPAALQYWFDSGDITMFICGLGFVLVGVVAKEAFKIAQENESFL